MQRNSRICMSTGRGFNKKAYHCGLYEAQDVLCGLDDVDLIAPEPTRFFRLREKMQKRLLWHDYSRQISHINPGLHAVQLKKEYEIFISVCQNFWDLLYVNAIKGWKDLCRVSICWIDEVWAHSLPYYKYWLPVLDNFDYVVISLKGSVSSFSEAIKRVCHYVPGGVDAIRFNPYPDPPPKVIDVYSIGRTHNGVHKSLLTLASQQKIFYIHDTFSGADAEVIDIQEHRQMYANLLKRCRYFIVWPAKMDLKEDTFGQIEVGFRYYEGAAAGAVLIGQTPDCESFRETFNWHDPVIEINPDGSDVQDVLSWLSTRPDMLREFSRNNAIAGLLRFDWAYRWKEIFGIAGIKPPKYLEERENKLMELAEETRKQ